jgi:DNA polymerase-4
MPTQSPTHLAKKAFELFQRGYTWRHPIRSVTVRAINLVEEDIPIQIDLFTDTSTLEKRERLDLAIESIRSRFGKDAIKNAILCQSIKLPAEREVELIMPSGMVS